MTKLVTTRERANRRPCWWPKATVLAALLLTGCGFNPAQLATPAVPRQPDGLKAAPGWVTDRMAAVAPDLYFEVNSHALPGPEQRKLARIANDLKAILHDFPDLIIVIESHCDDRGVAEYNEQLGLERADAVKGGLRNLGFPEDRLRAVSFSHREPLCVTPDDECRHKNRRVHFRAEQPSGLVTLVAGGGNR